MLIYNVTEDFQNLLDADKLTISAVKATKDGANFTFVADGESDQKRLSCKLRHPRTFKHENDTLVEMEDVPALAEAKLKGLKVYSLYETGFVQPMFNCNEIVLVLPDGMVLTIRGERA